MQGWQDRTAAINDLSDESFHRVFDANWDGPMAQTLPRRNGMRYSPNVR